MAQQWHALHLSLVKFGKALRIYCKNKVNETRSLTGLSDDNAVGHGGAVVVMGRALVRSLVRLGLFPADVNDESSRTRLHQDFGVFLYIKVGPISCP